MQVLATYHGSITECHGHALVEGPSLLRADTFRLLILGSPERVVLDRVRPESFTVEAIDLGTEEGWLWLDSEYEPMPDLA